MRKTVVLACALVAAAAVPALAQEVLFDQMVEAGDLKCFPVQGDATAWHYLPDRPHLAVDADGNPEFKFVMYTSPQHQGSGGITQSPGGGIVHFLVAYDVPPEVVREAQSELARRKPGAKLLGPVTYSDGTLAVETSMTDPRAGFLRRLAGVGSAPVMSGHKAAVAMHLTQEGAGLLWETFRTGGTSDVSVKFEMRYSGYFNPVEASMTIDFEKVHRTIDIEAAGRVSYLALEVDVMLQKMRDNGAIKIELKGAPPEQWAKVQELGLELARRQLFESTGAGGLEGAAAAGQQSPLDRLWKAYGDEWKLPRRTSWQAPPPAPAWLTAASAAALLSPRTAWRSGAASVRESIADASSPAGTGPQGLEPLARRELPPYFADKLVELQARFLRACALLADGRCGEALTVLESARGDLFDFPVLPFQGSARSVKALRALVDAYSALAAACAGRQAQTAAALRGAGEALREAGEATVAVLADTLRDTVNGFDGSIPPEARDRVSRESRALIRSIARSGQPRVAREQAAAAAAPGERAGELYRDACETYDRGEFQRSADAFQRVLEIAPDCLDCLWNLAVIGVELGLRDAALNHLDRYLAARPEAARTVFMENARRQIAAEPHPIPDARRSQLADYLAFAAVATEALLEGAGQQGAAPVTSQTAATQAPKPGDAGSTSTSTPDQGSQTRPGTGQATAAGTALLGAVTGATAGGTPAPGRTPVAGRTPTPGRTPAAGTTPTPTRTPASPTPRATAAPQQQPTTWGVLASFRLKSIQRSGSFGINLRQWNRSERPARFSANIGDLGRMIGSSRYFARVNIDDPVFRQREIPVTVDVASEQAFAAMLNAVTVTLRKVHGSGAETPDEVTISRAEFARAAPPTLLYGWDQDDDRTRWLEYDTRVRWSYVGGPVIETGWLRTTAGALVLEPPLRPRTLTLAGDMDVLRARGVRDVVVEVSHRAGAATRKASATVRVQEGAGERPLLIYQDPQDPQYSYTCSWRLVGGQRLASPLRQETADLIYIDELPPGP